jgi:CubicO group peptidase (beta-lactamase class C family)
MLRNHLARLDPPLTEFSPGEGFGLGGSVVVDTARRGRLTSNGAFGWTGAASTYYTIDPQEQLVAILLLQYLPRNEGHDLPKISTGFYNLVYQALMRDP